MLLGYSLAASISAGLHMMLIDWYSYAGAVATHTYHGVETLDSGCAMAQPRTNLKHPRLSLTCNRQ